MKKTWLLLFAALLLPVALLAKTTTIYHTSDVHGFFFPRNGQGGFAALEAVLKKGPQNYLLLDSGDFANGTVETRNSKGLKAVQIMNRMGYDAATIGNHEFDFKDAAVAPILANAQFAVLAANFFDKSTGKYPATVKPYKIFDVNGIKVAVIGLANRTPTTPAKSYSYGKPFDALEKALKEVEAKQPNFVMVIVHDSFKDEKHGVASYVGEIAKRFEGRVQVVLGGHAHNILQNKYVNGTLFVESGCYLNNVSRITVETDDKTGKVVSAKSELVPLIIAETGEDKAMKEYVDSLREPGVDEVVGEAKETLSKLPLSKDRQDSPLNDWIADLLRNYSGAQIAVHNNGGTRVDLKKGKVTKRDLIEIHPFDNTVTLVTVDGKFLKKFVKKGFAPRSLYTYSGLTITYKQTKRGKVKDLKLFIDGKPVENNKKYTLVTNSYIAGGGSEGWMFKQIPAENKKLAGNKTIRDLMEDALKKGPVTAPETGRIIKR